ncbi:MAG: hypothetical protein AcusKO_07710 [Acuticoccus sp.]
MAVARDYNEWADVYEDGYSSTIDEKIYDYDRYDVEITLEVGGESLQDIVSRLKDDGVFARPLYSLNPASTPEVYKTSFAYVSDDHGFRRGDTSISTVWSRFEDSVFASLYSDSDALRFDPKRVGTTRYEGEPYYDVFGPEFASSSNVSGIRWEENEDLVNRASGSNLLSYSSPVTLSNASQRHEIYNNALSDNALSNKDDALLIELEDTFLFEHDDYTGNRRHDGRGGEDFVVYDGPSADKITIREGDVSGETIIESDDGWKDTLEGFEWVGLEGDDVYRYVAVGEMALFGSGDDIVDFRDEVFLDRVYDLVSAGWRNVYDFGAGDDHVTLPRKGAFDLPRWGFKESGHYDFFIPGEGSDIVVGTDGDHLVDLSGDLAHKDVFFAGEGRERVVIDPVDRFETPGAGDVIEIALGYDDTAINKENIKYKWEPVDPDNSRAPYHLSVYQELNKHNLYPLLENVEIHLAGVRDLVVHDVDIRRYGDPDTTNIVVSFGDEVSEDFKRANDIWQKEMSDALYDLARAGFLFGSKIVVGETIAHVVSKAGVGKKLSDALGDQLALVFGYAAEAVSKDKLEKAKRTGENPVEDIASGEAKAKALKGVAGTVAELMGASAEAATPSIGKFVVSAAADITSHLLFVDDVIELIREGARYIDRVEKNNAELLGAVNQSTFDVDPQAVIAVQSKGDMSGAAKLDPLLFVLGGEKERVKMPKSSQDAALDPDVTDMTLFGNAKNNVLFGNDNGNKLKGGAGGDSVFGDRGDDTIQGGGGRDSIDGGKGNDALRGDGGEDTIEGGKGADTLAGGEGNDAISGGRGKDHLAGGAGNDTLTGGNGNDVLEADKGWDELDGGKGNDTLTGSENKSASMTGGAGKDVFVAAKSRYTNYVEDFDVDKDVVDFTSVVDDLEFSDLNFSRYTVGGIESIDVYVKGAYVGLNGVLRGEISEDNFLF